VRGENPLRMHGEQAVRTECIFGTLPKVRALSFPLFRPFKVWVSPAGTGSRITIERGRARRSVWGCSSAGRAPALQAGGRRFEPAHLHQGTLITE
jgi:hypothetical protein